MKIKMKQYEISCNKYREKFNSPDKWEFFCISGDSWLAGYKQAIVDCSDEAELKGTGDCIQEIDLPAHQIGMIEKHNLRDKEEILREILLQFGCKDVRISKDYKGLISFKDYVIKSYYYNCYADEGLIGKLTLINGIGGCRSVKRIHQKMMSDNEFILVQKSIKYYYSEFTKNYYNGKDISFSSKKEIKDYLQNKKFMLDFDKHLK